MELNALLAHPVALPSLPRAVALLMTELAHDEPSLRRVAQLIGTDPALAARLLELANTPAFQMQRQIAGIPEALALLGVVQLRSLVSSAHSGLLLWQRQRRAGAALAVSRCGGGSPAAPECAAGQQRL